MTDITACDDLVSLTSITPFYDRHHLAATAYT